MISKANSEVLIGLKNTLSDKRKDRKAKKLKLRGEQESLRNRRAELEEDYSSYKKALDNKLKNKRHEMELDLTLMEAEGFKNQTKWKSEVRLRTQPIEDENNQKLIDKTTKNNDELAVIETRIQAIQNELDDLDIEIDDIKWDLRIKLETYKEYQIVQVV